MSVLLSETDALQYLEQQPLEQKIIKINALFSAFSDIKDDLVQDIVALWHTIAEPTDEYCSMMIQTVYALSRSLHNQDDTTKHQIAEQIQWKLATLHQQEVQEKMNDDSSADELLESL